MNTDMDPKKIKLSDAIRDHYHVDPLKRDLAHAVLNKLPQKQPVYTLADRWTLSIGILFLAACMLYGVTLLSVMQFGLLILMAGVFAMSGLTAWKEVSALQRFVSAPSSTDEIAFGRRSPLNDR